MNASISRKRLGGDQKKINSNNSQPPSTADLKTKTPKYAKTEKESSPYVEGSIVRIKLTKFLTYESVEIKPGPHLNVIIGPNGTGKSAIVCAICLGLAGKTSWLGRASDPKDFIRHGCDKARIEIELFNPLDDMNYVIVREITFSKASSWWVNGRSVSQKSVEATVKQLNIQVGNLCQFLPQEKVADFARMSQQELLENTEKSLGEEALYDKHQELKQAREEARHLEGDVHKMVETLNQEKQRNARLEQDVKSFNDRKNFMAKVEVLKMKKPWLEYNILKEQHDRARAERDTKAAELKQQQKHLQPLERRHSTLKGQKEALEAETRDKTQRIRSTSKLIEDQQKNIANVSDKVTEARSEYDSKLREEQSRKKRLRDLQEQLKSLEQGLVEMDGTDASVIAASLDRVAKEMRNLSMNMSTIQANTEALKREIHNIKAETRAFENQLRAIQDKNNRRLETLRHIHANTYEAVMWLRQNTDKFKSTIHEPMIIGLNVTNPGPDAKIVETHISANDLRAFVCEDQQDLNLFMDLMKKQNFRVNSVAAPSKHVDSYQPRHPISHYSRYGFKRYVKDLFTCPDAVMAYCCEQYKVHLVPVGTDMVAKKSQEIIENCPELTNFYTPSNQYSIKRSHYTSSKSTRNTPLREPRALSASVNAERETELNRLIREQHQNMSSHDEEYQAESRKVEGLERRMNELREEQRELRKRKDTRKNLENQIITKRQRVQQIIDTAIDMRVEERKLQTQLKKVVAEKVKYLNKMRKATQECIELAKERVSSSFNLEENVSQFKIADNELRNARQRFDGLEREVQELKDQVQEVKQQARDKLTEAKRISEITGNDVLEDQLRRRGLWEDFNNAPGQLDELEGEIHSMQARAESMFQVDEEVVRDYHKREAEIATMEEALAQRESRRSTHQDDISKLREDWINPLTDLIGRINENFSFFFSSLQCAGEVSLNVPENPENYEKYGVCIKVKFRDDENLRELTAHHQSGGERSVSTVLYMMALQELTSCPFRCVDEINQGMDPRNERKVFQLVVQTVCKRSSSQYFLLTPKLLPDLEYGDHMTVLCVYNGPEMMDHTSWKLRKFIQKRAALEE